MPGGARKLSVFPIDNIQFISSVTNVPTIRIGDTSKNIDWIFMNDTEDSDEMGIIRGTPPNNLVFTKGQTSHWFVSGIMEKPISDFYPGGFSIRHLPYFTGSGIQVNVHSRVIPEPEEYALGFGLFSIGFIIFHSCFQKKGVRIEN